MVRSLVAIKSYFLTGKKPTQEQFHDTWESFYHRHDGIIIKHPSIEDVADNIETFTVLSQQGNINIPKSGSYTGSMETLRNELKFVPTGQLTVYKVAPNADPDQEIGDVVQGVIENTFFSGLYLGGNRLLLASYDIINSQPLPTP